MTTPARTNPVAALLLAAGAGRRFGQLKQLQEVLAGQSLVRRAAQTVLRARLPLHVVIGAEASRVREALDGLPLRFVESPDWRLGMGHSLAAGMQAIDAPHDGRCYDAALILLSDQPLLETTDLLALLELHHRDPDAILSADYGNEVLGPPCLFPRRFFPELQALQGDRGARALLRRHADAVRRVRMPHAATDVDTPEDLALAAERLARHPANRTD